MPSRRTLLKLVLALITWAPFGRRASVQAAWGEAYSARMLALAEAVLPQELGSEGRLRAVRAFMRWVEGYQSGAELDHGYGITQLRRAPPSPALNYPAQLDDLDRRSGGALTAATLPARQRAVAAAVAAVEVTVLPARPDGAHIATDLMAHFFGSPEAYDLAYGREIGRFNCRGLEQSAQRPAALKPAGVA